MKANQAMYPIATMCRVLGVSTSGYYVWLKREPSRRAQEDAVLSDRIEVIHKTSRQTYGAPRVWHELKDDGVRIGCKRVARLMRRHSLRGVSRRRGMRTTLRKEPIRSDRDRVDRNFTASRPNALWVADITYIPTWTGFLYLAVVMDVFSRRIVGWSMRSEMKSDLVIDALQAAVAQRDAGDVIHHSDQGSQYTSIGFGNRCRQLGVRPSMGSVGDCYDNAMCESFFATLECELIERNSFPSRTTARMAVFDYIEGWYNPRRRHSAIGYRSPIDFERSHAAAA